MGRGRRPEPATPASAVCGDAAKTRVACARRGSGLRRGRAARCGSLAEGVICAQAMLAVLGEGHGLNVDMDMGREIEPTARRRQGAFRTDLRSAHVCRALPGLSKDDPGARQGVLASRPAALPASRRPWNDGVQDLLAAHRNTAGGLPRIQKKNLVNNLCRFREGYDALVLPAAKRDAS
jgi:hypothetical protein